MNKKVVHSSSSRFNSDQICMFELFHATLPFPRTQQHKYSFSPSFSFSFVLWICILLGSSKTGQNHGNQGRAVWALLSEPQQAAGTSAPFFSQWQKASPTPNWTFKDLYVMTVEHGRRCVLWRRVLLWAPLPHSKKHIPPSHFGLWNGKLLWGNGKEATIMVFTFTSPQTSRHPKLIHIKRKGVGDGLRIEEWWFDPRWLLRKWVTAAG